MDPSKKDLDLWSGKSPAATSQDSETAKPEFKITRRGYDQTQVNDHLARETSRLHSAKAGVRRLQSEVDQARRQLEVVLAERDAALEERDAAREERDAALRERPVATEDTDEQMSSRVLELMAALNRGVEKLRGEAQREAEVEAEHILDHARGKATRMLSEAEELRAATELAAAQMRQEAERSVADLTAHRGAMVADLRLSFARSLETIGSLASSIRDESDASPADGNEPSEGSSGTSRDGRATPLVVLPETGPDRSAQSG
jgi:hypothetical protein